MNLTHLKHFIAVAENGSINRASEAIGITQAGLTKSIRALEFQLSAELFARSTRGVTLTAQGVGLLSHARLLTNQAVRAVQTVSALGQGVSVELRVGVSMRWALKMVIPELLIEFASDDSAPRLHIQSGRQSWSMIEELRNGELDIALATPTSRDDLKGLNAIFLEQDPQRIIVRKGHALDKGEQVGLKRLLNYSWVTGPNGSYFREFLNALFVTEGLTMPEPKIILDSSNLVLDVVARSDLIGISTARMITSAGAENLIMLETPGQLERETAILTRTDDTLSDPVKKVLNTLCYRLGNLPSPKMAI